MQSQHTYLPTRWYGVLTSKSCLRYPPHSAPVGHDAVTTAVSWYSGLWRSEGLVMRPWIKWCHDGETISRYIFNITVFHLQSMSPLAFQLSALENYE